MAVRADETGTDLPWFAVSPILERSMAALPWNLSSHTPVARSLNDRNWPSCIDIHDGHKPKLTTVSLLAGKVRRRHHRGAGDREDPNAPGIAGTRAATLTCAWPCTATGLTRPNPSAFKWPSDQCPVPRAQGQSLMGMRMVDEPRRKQPPLTAPGSAAGGDHRGSPRHCLAARRCRGPSHRHSRRREARARRAAPRGSGSAPWKAG